MWADRITIWKGLGCSPYFITTGSHPILPLDVVEVTWLVDYPNGPLATVDLIGLRAKALAKHRDHVEDMQKRVTEAKIAEVLRFEREHQSKIKDYVFAPGSLVLVRNTVIESHLDRKTKPRYLGPMVVVARNKGGAYMLAELDGSVWHERVAAFRVIPYFARHKMILPGGLKDFVDVSKKALEAWKATEDSGQKAEDDIWFAKMPNFTRADSPASSEEN